MVLTEAAPGFFRSVEKVAGKHFIVSLGSNSERNSYLAFPFVPAAPFEWNTPPPSAYHIAFEFIASLSAFPDGSSCFTLVMRASRHVFMSLEDFFGGQDTFVSDQTSERPPFRRARNTRRGIFSPTRFKQRFNRFVEKITPYREAESDSRPNEKNLLHPVVDSFPRVRLFPCTGGNRLSVIYGSGNRNRQAVSPGRKSGRFLVSVDWVVD